MVSERAGCSAFSTCRCAGLTERGECLFPIQRLGAGRTADNMDEGGAWVAGAVGQVLDCPGQLACARRSTAYLGRTAGGHVVVGDARDGARVCRAHPGSVLDRFHTAIGGVLPYEDSHLVLPAILRLAPGMKPCPDLLTARQRHGDRHRTPIVLSLLRGHPLHPVLSAPLCAAIMPNPDRSSGAHDVPAVFKHAIAVPVHGPGCPRIATAGCTGQDRTQAVLIGPVMARDYPRGCGEQP